MKLSNQLLCSESDRTEFCCAVFENFVVFKKKKLFGLLLLFNDYFTDDFGRVVGIRLIEAPVLHPVSITAQSEYYCHQIYTI